MLRSLGVLVLLALTAPVGSARAQPPVEAGQLAGDTLSAVAYVRRVVGSAQSPRAETSGAVDAGGGELQRIMLQAYLAADGGAQVRQWLPERNRYSAPATSHWSLEQNRLCIDMPAVPGTSARGRSLCAVVHIWWPRIAGISAEPYAMLDGDLQRGNTIGGRTAR